MDLPGATFNKVPLDLTPIKNLPPDSNGIPYDSVYTSFVIMSHLLNSSFIRKTTFPTAGFSEQLTSELGEIFITVPLGVVKFPPTDASNLKTSNATSFAFQKASREANVSVIGFSGSAG